MGSDARDGELEDLVRCGDGCAVKGDKQTVGTGAGVERRRAADGLERMVVGGADGSYLSLSFLAAVSLCLRGAAYRCEETPLLA